MSETWWQRCVPCSQDIPNGKMAEHLRESEKCRTEREPHVPFRGKVNEPEEFPPHMSPKV